MKARTRNPMGLLGEALGRGGHVVHGGALRRLLGPRRKRGTEEERIALERGKDRDGSRKCPDTAMWLRASRRWLGVVGMLATAAAACLARGGRQRCPWAGLPR